MKTINKENEIQKFKELISFKMEIENKFISKYCEDSEKITFDNFIKKVRQISFGNKYALWIVQRYSNDGILRFEDLDRTETALSYFHRYNQRLDIKNRNIMNIKSLVDLENLVEPFAQLDKQKELEKLQKEKIYSETKVLYDGLEGKIVIPLTKEASIFWGQGTKWCTSSTGSYNYFERYNKQGPLYIFITPEKDAKGREIKYQFHFETNQFMDIEDKIVNVDKLPQEKIVFLLEFNGKIIKFIKNKKNIYKILSIKQTLEVVKHVDSIPIELEFEFLKKDKNYIKFCKDLISFSMDEEHKKIQMNAIEYCPEIVLYMIKPTKEMISKAIEIKPEIICEMRYPSKKWVLKAIEQKPEIIDIIPDKSKYMYEYAWKKHHYSVTKSTMETIKIKYPYIIEPEKQRLQLIKKRIFTVFNKIKIFQNEQQ